MSNINKLTEILNKSKAIMNKTDSEYGVATNMVSEQSSHQEKEIPNLTENFVRERTNTTQSVAPQGGQYRNLKTSKMPQAVLQAMVEEPISIPESPNHTFELSDVEDLVNESPTPQPTTTTPRGVHERSRLLSRFLPVEFFKSFSCS